MKDLLAFQDWAIEKGHYQTIASLERYFKLLESRANEGTINTSKDNKEVREGGSLSNQSDNSK
jgi:hypothetical protein